MPNPRFRIYRLNERREEEGYKSIGVFTADNPLQAIIHAVNKQDVVAFDRKYHMQLSRPELVYYAARIKEKVQDQGVFDFDGE